MDPVIPLIIASSLAILWLTAGASKLRSFGAFSAILADYRLIPPGATAVCAATVIAIELCLGVGLVVPVGRDLALIGSALVLVLYAGAIAVNLLRGAAIHRLRVRGFRRATAAERLAGRAAISCLPSRRLQPRCPRTRGRWSGSTPLLLSRPCAYRRCSTRQSIAWLPTALTWRD